MLGHSVIMKATRFSQKPEGELEAFLHGVKEVMVQSLAATPLQHLISDFDSLLGTGKMLRSRMAYRVGPVSGIPMRDLVCGCAAVELIHAASLLHDDVIDGGIVRRGAPTFWRERGISGAILLGDLLLFKALDITCTARPDGKWTSRLVKLTGEVCEAESEQELVLRGEDSGWEDCVSIARRKTGALFAFVGYALGNGDEQLQAVLQAGGYAVGTAYQLADDILDATGSEEISGKTLGTDAARHKTTAVSASRHNLAVNPVASIEAFCLQSQKDLRPWPAVEEAWGEYLEFDIRPAIDQILQAVPGEQVS